MPLLNMIPVVTGICFFIGKPCRGSRSHAADSPNIIQHRFLFEPVAASCWLGHVHGVRVQIESAVEFVLLIVELHIMSKTLN
jgi:hypothetical protein